MMTNTTIERGVPAIRRLRMIALVSDRPEPRLIDEARAVGHFVVFVQWNAHTYSNIKRVAPDLIIVCMPHDDLDGCRVLSMLKLDRDTARIPVVTCLMSPQYSTTSNPLHDDIINNTELRVSLN